MTSGNETSSVGGLDEILITARPLDEYRAMFGLTDTDLGRRILDCPSGASSFTAEMGERGGDVTACDAAYFALGAEEIAEVCVAQTDRGNEYVRAHADDYRWTFFTEPDEHRRRRRAAVERFVADRHEHCHRYIAGSLPSLPFPDNSFDLVLSSHLLFSYAEALDYDFHLDAIRELIRVARIEVRIFPLVPVGSTRPYPRLGELRDHLLEFGIESAVIGVDYEFQKGATQMLTCRLIGN